MLWWEKLVRKEENRWRFVLAFPNEVDAIMQVMEEAKKCLADVGSDQWQNGYPNADIIIEDIISGQAL